MAYTNPFKIKNGLALDFTLDAADTANDNFLGRNSAGEVTSFSAIPITRLSGAGNLTEATSSVLTITGGTGAVLSGLTIQVKLAGAGQSGYLSTTDWNTFNNKLTGSLTSGSILVGNGSNVATATDTVSIGDILGNSGTGLTIKSGVITNAMIGGGAGITRSKLASGTAYRLIANNNTGVISENAAITGSRVVVSDVNGQLVASNITTTQINNILTTVAGLPTSLLVTAPTGSEDGYAITWDNGNSRWTLIDPVVTGLPTGGTTGQFIIKDSGTNFDVSWTDLLLANITDVSASAAEVNILSGVTTSSAQLNFSNTLSGNIQDQLDSKLSTALTQYYMFVGNASNIATPFATGANGYVLTSVGGVPTWVSPGSGGTVTSVAGSGGTTGLSFSGSPITTSGTLTLGGTLAVANGGTGLTATTVGGLLLGTSTSAFTNLTIGANGYVLTSNGTTASWQAAPSGMVYPSAGLAKSTGSAWDTSITDNSADWNTAYGWGDHATAGYLTALTDGNGTTANGTAVDLGGTTTGNTLVTGQYDIEHERSENFVVAGPLWNATDRTGLKLQSGGFKLNGSLSNDGGVFGTRTARLELINNLSVTSTTGYYQWLMESVDPVSTKTTLMTLDPYYFKIQGGTSAYEFLKFDFTNSDFNFKRASDDNGFNFNNSDVFIGNGGLKRFGFDATGSYINLGGSDATGDTYYRNSSGYFTRLPAGTNGHVLTLASGIPSWAAPSGGGLTVGTSTITSGSNTKILYDNSGVLGEYTVSGSGNVAMTTSPTFTTPALGTPSGVVLTNGTGLPPVSGISGWPSNASGVLTNNGSGTLSWGSASGITNSAANNELMKSNGTNAVASGIFSASAGSVELGTGLSGASRTVLATGSATDVGLNLDTKGAGPIVFKLNGTAQGAGIGAVTGQVAIGSSAGLSATGATYSNFFGLQSGQSATNATYCNFFGPSAGQGASSATNANFFGREAGLNGTNVGYSNFFGYYAGRSATNGSYSNFFGQYAGQGATNASNSNFFGKQAGYNATNASYSNLFGFQSGMTFTSNNLGSNNIIIGTNISLGDAVANSMNIGGVLFGKGFYSTITGNPSITAVAAGQIGIGQVTPTTSTRLDVTGISSGHILRLANSSDTRRFNFSDAGVMTIDTAPTDAASTSDHLLTRDVSSGDIEKLSIGSGLSIVSGALTAAAGSIAAGAALFVTSSQGSVSMTASGSGTTSLPITPSAYGNKTILVVETQFMAMKSDGTAAAFSTVTSMFRKDNSGTWTVDTAGTSTTSDVTTIVSITGAIGGGVPSLSYTAGAYSGTYSGGFTCKLSSYQY